MTQSTLTLNNGITIPQVGFGVFMIPSIAETEEAIIKAFNAGYRHIDTAAAYMNEAAVGSAIEKAGLAREEVFVTSKLWPQDYGYENAKKAIDESLTKLGLDYMDMYLLHLPYGDYYGAWHAMEEAYKEGKVKAIGVSNFYADRLLDFVNHIDIIPAVDQIETHPFYHRNDILEIAKEYNIAIEAWAPFAEGKFNIFSHPVLTEIGNQYGKTAAQVALRWNLDRGVIVLPKSVNQDRIDANFDVFDFKLSEDDMAKITELDMGHSEITDHTNPEFIKFILAQKIHD